jgi:hypothetical protein
MPALAGTAVVLAALPIFAAAGWRLAAWGIAAGLWAVYQAIGAWLDRVPMGIDSVAAAGIVAFGRMTRAVVLVAVLIVVAVKDSGLGLPAAIVYGIAFSVEFGASLLAYLTGQASA